MVYYILFRFFMASYQASKIRRLYNRYTFLKKCSVNRHLGFPVPTTKLGKLKKCLLFPFHVLGIKNSREYESLASFEPENGHFSKFWLNYLSETQRESIISLFFWCFGTLLAWIAFTINYNFSFENRTFLTIKHCSFVIFLGLSMATFKYFRCLIMLTIPIMISSRGRALLITYLMIALLNGPGANINSNLSETWRSLKCSFKLMKKTSEDAAKGTELYKIFAQIVKQTNQSLRSVKDFYENVGKLAIDTAENLASTAKKIAAGIKGIGDICQASLREWVQRCDKALSSMVKDCFLGRKELCWPFLVPGNVFCYTHVPMLSLFRGAICPDFSDAFKRLSKSIIKPIKSTLKTVKEDLYAELKLSIKHSYDVEEVEQLKLDTIFHMVLNYYSDHFAWFFAILLSLDFITYAFSFLWIFRAWHYLRKYQLYDSFDNQYINDDLFEIELRRFHNKEATIFPLNFAQKKRYVRVWTFEMAANEFQRFLISLVIFIVVLIMAIFFIVLEYVVYWPSKFVKEMAFSIATQIPKPTLDIQTQGDGPFRDLYQQLSASGEEAQINFLEEADRCVPDPIEPDSRALTGIAFFLLVLFIAATFEVYALRMRHLIAGYLYPKRRLSRAAWLYSYILSTKNDVIDFARKRLCQKLQGDDTAGDISIWRRFAYSNSWLKKIYELFFGRTVNCVQCAKIGDQDDRINYQKCPNRGCTAVYCKKCIQELTTSCVVCYNPAGHRDLDDFEEEVDSSEDGSTSEEEEF